jgi:ABC-type polar amino acid transport system ATPase subunit
LVMVEHHEEVARSIADRIWSIEDGKQKELEP